jgi:hypothetical protein
MALETVMDETPAILATSASVTLPVALEADTRRLVPFPFSLTDML